MPGASPPLVNTPIVLICFSIREFPQFVSSFTQYQRSQDFNAKAPHCALNHSLFTAPCFETIIPWICVKIRARKCHFVLMLSVPTSLSSSLNSGMTDAYRWRGTRRQAVSIRWSTGMSPSKIPARLMPYSLLLREGTRIYSFLCCRFIRVGCRYPVGPDRNFRSDDALYRKRKLHPPYRQSTTIDHDDCIFVQ